MGASNAELRAGCEAVFDSLLSLLPQFSDGDWARETGCPGWDVRDNIAHIVTLEQVVLGDDLSDHHAPTGLPHVRDEFGQFMENLIDPWRARPTDELVEAARETFDRRRQQMANWTDADWDEGSIGAPGGGTATPSRFLPIRIFDAWAHEQDVRRATGNRGHLDGPAAAISLWRCSRGFAHSFAKGLGEPERIVSLHVTGPTARDYTLDLASGRSTEGAPDDADVAITGDIEAIVALGCGRADAPDPDTLTWEGDTALATSLRQHLAFTP